MKRVAILAALLLIGAAPARQVARPVDAARLLADEAAPLLSAYRLFADTAGRVPAPGVMRYTLNTPLFSDYAEKFRYVWMPAGTRATYAAKGVLEFPVGTTIVKSFAYPADFRAPDKDVRIIETRLLVRRADGWVPLSYVWNAAQTEAVLKRAGVRVPVAYIDAAGAPKQLDYAVPNINQCKQCHQQDGAAVPIGPTASNLNGGLDGHGANQLATWAATGKLTGPPANPPKLARWDDTAAPVADRARAYLDVNCGHCHSPKGFASNSGLYLQHDEPDPAHQGIGKRPVAAGRGSGGLLFAIAPGQPEASILLHRMESSEPGVMMPQFGRTVSHAEGVALVRAYIAGLK
ncbi:SO2930 family diheme c-type cytochrome [Sandarakinorhabdus sp. DWP1-3-1]|uniref:SO2930 family diheme c-type cytochrome n=1 Tax=Sandarakinorhabdus sp. DWP1-3-1 TaxID=2804627 RepID=UPI003CF308D5